MNDEDALRPSIKQQSTHSAELYVARAEMNTDLDVPQFKEDNELTIDVLMEKDVIHTDGLGRCMIEVSWRMEIKSDDVMEFSNEEGHGRSSKGAGMDKCEGEVRKEGRMWGRWRSGRGVRGRGVEAKKDSVDVHENKTAQERTACAGGTTRGPKTVVYM